MKKILIFVFSLLMISSTCFAFRSSYEPESDTSASFAVISNYGSESISFVKYASIDKTDEYWIRFTIMRDNNKILYNALLSIDGETFPLTPVSDVSSKYTYAATSILDHDIFSGISGAQPFRYYLLDKKTVDKIMSSSGEIVFIYSRIDHLNKHLTLDKPLSNQIRKIYSLQYSDLNKYWNPSK